MKPKQYQRSITPEKAQQLLADMGITISLAKAVQVLDFMYKNAILEVENFNNKK